MARDRHRRFNWVCVPWLLAATAALGGCIWIGLAWQRHGQLRQHGVHVQARLEGKDRHDSRNSVSYHVRYRFETPDGRSWQGTSSVGPTHKDDWSAADGTVEVMYLSEDPAVNSWVIGLRGHDTVLAIVFVPLALGACLALVIGIKAARSSPGAFRRWLAERYYR